MKDLNSKLGLGPPKAPEPKEEEKVEEEKAPLADARKGRARGPQRRKPGVSPSAGAGAAAAIGDEQPAKAGLGFSIASPWTMWTVGEEGELEVGGGATKMAGGAEAAQVPDEMAPVEPTRSLKEKEDPMATAAVADSSAATVPTSQTANTATSIDTDTAAATLPDVEAPSSPSKPTMTDAGAQTGQQEMHFKAEGEGSEKEAKFTTYLGGRAPEKGNVVVTDRGEEILADPDGKGDIEKTGHGM